MYIYVCMCVCVYMYTCIYICVVCRPTHTHTHTHKHTLYYITRELRQMRARQRQRGGRRSRALQSRRAALRKPLACASSSQLHACRSWRGRVRDSPPPRSRCMRP